MIVFLAVNLLMVFHEADSIVREDIVEMDCKDQGFVNAFILKRLNLRSENWRNQNSSIYELKFGCFQGTFKKPKETFKKSVLFATDKEPHILKQNAQDGPITN